MVERRNNQAAPSGPEWDATQKVIIEHGEDQSTVVEAGPGTGKTAVACRRIAYLIEDRGLAPSNILMVSFTRAAIKELRDRIASYANSPLDVAGLRICTLDSFTWQILRGLEDRDPVGLLGGYEGNIQAFIDALDAEEEFLIGFLDGLEHVVIDEAQDLVGIRAQLVMKLIGSLPGHCGVTVLADSAQAIYGWTTEQDRQGAGQETVVDMIRGEWGGEFRHAELTNIHRTSDRNLADLWRMGRALIGVCREAIPTDWSNLREIIVSEAHEASGARLDPVRVAGMDNLLVLYRTRLEVLSMSSTLWSATPPVPHKIRMSGIPIAVEPWVARCLSSFRDARMKREAFRESWSCNNAARGTSLSPDQAWEFLLDVASADGSSVDMRRLRSVLGRSRPPAEFVIGERELPGPTLGTIHSSKGREADEVHLVLPRSLRPDDPPAAIAEEMRVLFVGASRARCRLTVGDAAPVWGRYLERSSRIYRKTRTGERVQIQVGLEQDVDAAASATTAGSDDLQERLWRLWTELRAGKPGPEIAARYESLLGVNALYIDKGLDGKIFRPGPHMGFLGREFGNDLFAVGKAALGQANVQPPSQIRHLRIVAVRTVVVPEVERTKLVSPYRESGFLLAPVVSGFPSVKFLKRWRY